MAEHEDKEYASPTPNHGLYRHGQGYPNWAYEADMETIEARLPVKDIEANLDQYDPHEGATFLATDSDAAYDGTGSEWTEAPWASSSSGTGLTESDDATITGNWTFDGTLTYGTTDVATDDQLFSGSYSDLTDVPSEFSPEAHGNTAHSTNYLAESDYTPESDTHGRYDNSEAISAINNDTDHGSTAPHNYFSGDYADLSNVPSTFTPETHSNSSHSTNYADQNHDNTAHAQEFVSDGDGTTRQIWVIANGASDPAGASADDLIFEEEA